MKVDQLVEARWAKESSCVMIHSFYPYYSFCDLDIALDLLQLLEHFNIWGSISVIFQEKIQTFPQIIGFFFLLFSDIYVAVNWVFSFDKQDMFHLCNPNDEPDSKLPPIFFFYIWKCPVLYSDLKWPVNVLKCTIITQHCILTQAPLRLRCQL